MNRLFTMVVEKDPESGWLVGTDIFGLLPVAASAARAYPLPRVQLRISLRAISATNLRDVAPP